MSTPNIALKTETRMLGAAQVIIGLIHCALGYIWMQLYIRQYPLLSMTYLPLTLLSGYPFLACMCYVISGIFAIKAEKKCSPKLLKCTINVNIYSSTTAIIGLLIVKGEIMLFLVKEVKIQWPQRSGIILSVYLWIFSILEFCIAKTVVKWGTQAANRDSYSYNKRSPFILHNFLIKMPRRYLIREDCRAMGASQIIIGMIHWALAFLCFRLFLQEQNIPEFGIVSFPVTIFYAFGTPSFIVATIILNIISICFAAIGVIILALACLPFGSKSNDYVWTHLAKTMLLQFLLFSTIAELIIASFLVSWLVKVLRNRDHDKETSLGTEEKPQPTDSTDYSESESIPIT